MFQSSLFVYDYDCFKKIKTIRKFIKTLSGMTSLAVLTIVMSCSNTVANQFNILDYGAIADEKTLNTEAIQMTILQAVASKGTVIIPKGKFYTGSLTLGPNITIFFEEGAELIASSDMKDYHRSSFIFAPETHNITIKGKGVINGNGKSFFDENWEYKHRPQPWILFQDTKNISISGITLINSPSHCLVFNFCEGVTVDNVIIKNHPKSPNTDGIDISNSKDVFITNCNISTGDDAICIKNKKEEKFSQNTSQTRSRYTEQITVKNCTLTSDDAALKLGTGSAHHTRRCTFQDITIKESRYGIALFMMDGGKYSDINFQNINIHTGGRHTDEYGIFIDTHRRDSISKIGSISNINFKNINIVTNGLLYFSGYPEKEIKGITLEDIKITIPNADNTIATNWKKPKGNKKIKYWKNTLSYVQSPGSIIVAHAEDFKIKDLSVTHQQGEMARHGLYLIDVKVLDTTNIKGNTLHKESFVFVKK